jgi:short-subunit dehydrogenase
MLPGMRRLAGRVAVVTGAASGIGRALALALARRGMALALVDVNEAGLAETADLVRGAGAMVSVHVADVADRARMERLPGEVLAEHGHVHLLVNNAGVSVSGALVDQSLDDFAWLMGINFWGVVYGCKLFLPHLLAEDEAHIVNVSSMFGFIGVPTQISYNAAKYGVRGVSDALLSELSGTRVGVTVVHPGGIRTNIVRASRSSTARDVEETKSMAEVFERRAMAPERAAEKIVRGIERDKGRVRIGAEAYVADWAKRLFPTGTQRLLGFLFRRRRARPS